MNSENIAATPAQERIDAVEVQERLSWPGAPATAYCDTWLMINAGALNFKATEELQVAVMANIGHQLLQEIAAYRPTFKWTNSPVEIIGALAEEAASHPLAPSLHLVVPDGWKLLPLDPTTAMIDALYHDGYAEMLEAAPSTPSAQGAGTAFARQLIDSGAENFIGEVFDTERGEIEVTARYISGKTPADKLAELEARITTTHGDAKVLTDDEIVSVLHSLGIDTHPSKYGFPETQVSATNVPGIRRLLTACAAIATSKAGA
ncbi:hypothetical protein [Janthinobacterium sp. SUN120]|uniref:hypothetical protein n=1 Tax=Janthinobacterium sp. SUN120 TaxID=3004099 RepID=UPI0025AFA33C|nr:hypothetical protein [Janthinobacterium sp. SUN120]MDN2716123.1 hypothetical protein [Janthinobacterium sp. SUN120]